MIKCDYIASHRKANKFVIRKMFNYLTDDDYMGLRQENLSSGVCEQQRCRPACKYVQSDAFVIRYLESIIC